ncbi:MAG: TA system antitoxin ParD family protein [Panacagrimonas sp.]
MGTAFAPVRLEAEITDAARDAASSMSRSVAQQVSHWARIGRELERSPEVSADDIRRVLDGAGDYDQISTKEQAVVRAVWSGRGDSLRSGLRLDKSFQETGYRYAELDGQGEVVVREPSAPKTQAAVKTRKPRRS